MILFLDHPLLQVIRLTSLRRLGQQDHLGSLISNESEYLLVFTIFLLKEQWLFHSEQYYLLVIHNQIKSKLLYLQVKNSESSP